MNQELSAIGAAFGLRGAICSAEPLTDGLINRTVRVTCREGQAERRYIFQQINHHVFPKPEEVMENTLAVCTHLKQKKDAGLTGLIPLAFHRLPDGRGCLKTANGDYWRISDEIPSCTVNGKPELKTIREIGSAFGEFAAVMADFDGNTLHTTIPDFHNTGKRLDTLFAHAAADPLGRKAEVLPELLELHRFSPLARKLSDAWLAGSFPVRVTHNDTKGSNVLLDKETGRALAVIDLDTVMPGLSVCDFGDSARSLTNRNPEDGLGAAKPFDREAYEVLKEAWVSRARGRLLREELDALDLAAFSLTTETAARFLDDYLTGDTYFRTVRPGQNLDRTRSQLALAEAMAEELGLIPDTQ